MKIMMLVSCMLTAVCCFAATQSISLQSIQEGGGAAEVASTDELITVTAKGSGTTKIDALKDAYREAVEKAVGQFVDAEQLAKNDEVLTDQVLTQSNAYIEKYDILKESEADGLVKVFIKARVRKTALAKKISGFMLVQTQNLGGAMQDLHAKVVSTDKRNEDGAALLQNFMKDFDPIRQLVGVGLASTTPVVRDCKGDPDRKAIYYRYKFSLDDNRYKNDFLPKFQQLLTQVSVAPVKKIRLAAQSGKGIIVYGRGEDCQRFMEGPFGDDRQDVQIMNRYIKQGKGMYESHKFLSANFDGQDCVFTGSEGYLNVLYPLRAVKMFGMRSGSSEEKIMGVILVTEFNSSKSSCVAEIYSLDPKVGCVLGDWWAGYLGRREDLSCAAVFKDAKGEEVEVARFKAKVGCLTCAGKCELGNKMLRRRQRQMGKAAFDGEYLYIAPLLGCDGVDYCQWVPCEIRRDDLARITSVSVEFAE